MSSAPLPPVGATPQAAPSTTSTQSSPSSGEQGTFKDLLFQVNSNQLNAEQAVQDLVTGKNDDVQQVVMQVVKSEMSFQLFMEVRNQLIESYNEIMRMQF